MKNNEPSTTIVCPKYPPLTKQVIDDFATFIPADRNETWTWLGKVTVLGQTLNACNKGIQK